MGDGLRLHGETGSIQKDLLGVLLIGVIVVAVLYPLFTRSTGNPPTPSSYCHSNMKQIGNAFKMYLSDWDNHYPTNRALLKDGSYGPITPYVKLSPQAKDEDGQSARFVYGLNWVESLYAYVESVSKDAPSVWRCPVVEKATRRSKQGTAAVSYVYNRNLVEKDEGVVKMAATLMLVREMDRMVNSELRPRNDSTGSPKTPPDSPFLSNPGGRVGVGKPGFHGDGSHILFADGHVKQFDKQFHPSGSQCKWDSETEQWYNFVYHDPENDTQRKLNKSIAVSP